MALCEVCTATHYEDLSEIFLKIFDTPKSIAKFLKVRQERSPWSPLHSLTLSSMQAVIEMEVSVTGARAQDCLRLRKLTHFHLPDHESTLFRGNSFATRILTAYARARGYHCESPP